MGDMDPSIDLKQGNERLLQLGAVSQHDELQVQPSEDVYEMVVETLHFMLHEYRIARGG